MKCDFKGIDYRELIDCWNLDISDVGISDCKSEKLSEFIHYFIMNKIMYNNYTQFTKKALNDMRRFIDKLRKEGEGDGGYSIMWRALYDIKNDFVFCQMFVALIGHMWI